MLAIHDVPAPAKLNLFLHVTGRRPDGYHLLQSVFMLIDWCDTLHFERCGNGEITRTDLGDPLPAEDLVVRAARALQEATGTTFGAHVSLEKRIPSQAGMGGGSSDAASTLLALNRLWNTKLPLAALGRMGLALGADVPFFLRGHNAWVEGIGERIRPIEIPRTHVVVVKPAAGLETRLIFADPALRRSGEAATISGFAADPIEEFERRPYSFGRNDLQAVAERLCPDVRQALQWLDERGLQGRMTGSGSAVFAICPSDKALESLGDAPDGWQVRICGNLDVHPLAGWASSDDSSVAG